MSKNFFVVVFLGIFLASCNKPSMSRVNRNNSNVESTINNQATKIGQHAGSRTSTINQYGRTQTGQ